MTKGRFGLRAAFGLVSLWMNASCVSAASASARCGASVAALSGGAGYETIQAAVDDAPDGGTVTVCPGTHDENLTVSQALTLAGSESAPTVIDGGSSGQVLDATGIQQGSVTLQDLTLQGGSGSPPGEGDPYGGARGGAISFGGPRLLMERVTLQNNGAAVGSALFDDGAMGASEVVLTDCVVQGNVGQPDAEVNYGAIAMYGWFILSAINSTFSNNDVADIGFDSSVPPYDPQLFAVPAGDTEVECDDLNNTCSFH